MVRISGVRRSPTVVKGAFAYRQFVRRQGLELPFVGDKLKRRNGRGYEKRRSLKKKFRPFNLPFLAWQHNFFTFTLSLFPSASSPLFMHTLKSSLFLHEGFPTQCRFLSGILCLWRLTEIDGTCGEAEGGAVFVVRL